jgi:hypothetical protein
MLGITAVTAWASYSSEVLGYCFPGIWFPGVLISAFSSLQEKDRVNQMLFVLA